MINSQSEYIYSISVKQTEWNENVRKNCHRWIKSFMKDDSQPFRWGILEKIRKCEYVKNNILVCNVGGKTLRGS
jgi:hypothetical protein